jgi:predicted dipeptidase
MDFKQYEKAIINDVIRLVNIPSILDESNKEFGKPFGDNINRCLDETLLLCESLGMKTYKDEAGYYGFAEIGKGKNYIGIMCHLDVVPAGDLSKWDTPPFQGVYQDGYIFGRGTGDDKGPTISAIYAVKALLDSKVTLHHRIRLIFGTDEETLWRGIDKYKESEQDPIFAIAADGYFPFTYAEKGLLQLDLIKPRNYYDTVINGGENYNSVAANAIYQGKHVPVLKAQILRDEIDYLASDDKLEIIGIPSHASRPEIGKNAVLYLAKLFRKIGKDDDHLRILTDVFNYEYDKTKLFDKEIKDHTGSISINIGGITMDDTTIKIKLDLRLPVSYTKDEIIHLVEKKVGLYGFKVSFRSYLNPLYVDLESAFAQTLLTTYQEITGDYQTKPRINGGATFARAYPDRAVCYGVKMEGRPSFAHEPNERIDLESLIRGVHIYYETLVRLDKNITK